MSIGKLEAFDLARDSWDSYIDRLEQYFVVNDVKETLKVATLITIIGSEAYELLVNLCTPAKPSSKTYSDLVSIMKGHLQPKPSILAERYIFRQRLQRKEESIAEYVTELKKLTKHCGFTSQSLSENLRDQFVCGLSNDSIRQRLFTEEDIGFERAYKLAISMEAAEVNAAIVENHAKRCDQLIESAVHKVVSMRNNVRRGESQRSGSGGGGAASYSGRSSARIVRGANPAATGAGVNNNNRSRDGNSSRPTGNREANDMMRSQGTCEACGGRHNSSSCQFTAYVCRVCNRRGHLKRVCPNLQAKSTLYNMTEEVLKDDSDGGSDEVNNFCLQTCKMKNNEPYKVNVCVNNVNLEMEIDTGSAVSCISYDCYKRYFPQCQLTKSDLSLRYYTGERVEPVGMFTAEVSYQSEKRSLNLYIVNKGNVNLLGRQWLNELCIDIYQSNCNNIVKNDCVFNLEKFSSRYYEVFSDGLGRYTGGTVGFQVREGARPVFMRARPLAYALREPVERALDSLVKDGVITPVNTSDWATPIVPVMKKDGDIRVCGDFKITLNKVLEVDRFPLPRVEDLLTKLHGGDKFTKIDLSQAYSQFELDEKSKQYTVINTHRGLFRYNRLIFGLASSPGIFQRKLEQLFADMPRVGVFLDDLIITGRNDQEHIETLHEVFGRLAQYGLKIKKEKCSFFTDSVTYLGFVIDRDGVHTSPEKIQSILQVPVPQNVSELRSFLGLVMYYAKFVSNISTLLSPLYKLLRKESKYIWDEDCDRAFSKVKEMLVSSEVLAHYSPELPLVLTTDASSVGVGAVISHVTPQRERPIAYASRALNSAERAYSQIEREALAIIFGIRKFHQYLYGRKFVLRTDHKPLVAIFGDKYGIPVMAASRMQRWAVLLSGYDYSIEYVSSKKNSADALSRLPVGRPQKESRETTYVNFVQNFLPITRKTVQEHMRKDKVLQKVMLYIQSGWPSNCEDESLKSYSNRRNELYNDMGCIVWGYRLVIPATLREELLKELHVGHLGVVKMKSLARSVMWWPGIDADIERECRECAVCVAESAAPPRAPPQPWPHVTEPWTRLHLDFLGPIMGKTFLILIDSSTKWLEAFHMPRTTAGAVIKVLRETFARFGLPREVVTDNGPPFTSQEYAHFMTSNGIRIAYSAAYHPSSNGAAEGAVKLCKRAIKKASRDQCDIDVALQTYLMAYRNVEHSTTGASPAMLLQRRQLRTRLDLLRSTRQVEDRVREVQERQVSQAGGVSRDFKEGDKVHVRNFTGGEKWVRGSIKQKLGSRNYLVNRENGPPVAKHIDQLRRRSAHPNKWSSFSEPNSEGESNETREVENPSGSRVLAPSMSSSDQTSSPTVPLADARRPGLRPRDMLRPVMRYGFEID